MKILLIGGSKGLGEELIAQLQDHEVLALYRTSSPPLDLTWEASKIKETIRMAIDILDGIDVLLVSAGVGAYLSPLPKEEDVENLFRTNVLGVMAVYQGALKGLLKSKGKAVLVSSTCARRPGSGGLSYYGSSKAALNAFVMNEGRRAARHGVALCSVSVGFFESPMTKDMVPALKEATVKAIPFGRWGHKEEIAAFIASLVWQSNWCLAGSNFELSGGA